MFQALGRIVTRGWPWVLLGWATLWLTVFLTRPAWSSVSADGEFAFLPPNSPSLAAERQFRERFGKDLLQSTIVLVVSRPPPGDGDAAATDAGEKLSKAEADRFLTELLRELQRTLIDGGFARPDLRFGDLPTLEGEPRSDEEPTPPGEREEGARLLLEGEELQSGGGDGRTANDGEPLVAAVMTPRDRVIGPLFRSRDGQAALVVLGLRT
ncbi:MAG: hypothetical protein AAF907_14095, partial [Planctomycetota bacterium]